MDVTFAERDEFKRKVIAEKTISLLRGDVGISPMIIDGGWGTGKTEFCRKLINLMAEDGTHHLIYVDAFKADHAGEPLMTVLAEVIKVLPSKKAKEAFIKKVLPAARFSLKALAKAGVSHVLRRDTDEVASTFDEEMKKAAGLMVDASVHSMLKDHVEADKNLAALQKALKEIATKKPIVLFIDELDRCRPDFAINLLEVIKHTFDVDGVQFVLITNTEQLKRSVSHCYGLTAEGSQRYLDKFIKFKFQLISKSDSLPSTQASASFNHFYNLLLPEGTVPSKAFRPRLISDFVEHLIARHELSLREVETLVLYMSVLQEVSKNQYFVENQILGSKLLVILGVFIFCLSSDLKKDIEFDRNDALKLADFLGVTQIPAKIGGGQPHPKTEQVLMVMLAEDCIKNINDFRPQGEERRKWGELLHHFGSSSYIEKGESTSVLKSVFLALSLGA